MRIPSGKTDQNIYFVAVDATDLKTRKTGLSSFTVYRSRNNGAATAYTTPTVTEVSAANMPGVYGLLLDEDTTIAAAVWDRDATGHQTQGTFGQAIGDPGADTDTIFGLLNTNLDTTVSSRLASASISLSGGSVTVGTNNDKTGYTASTVTDKTGYALSSAGVQAIWDALTSALTTVGSIGKKLTDWALGTDNRVLVSANAHTSGETIAGNAGNIAGSVGSVATGGISSGSLAASAQNAIADAVLDRNMAAGTDSGTNSTAVRTPRQALRALRNKVTVSAGTATITKEDDVATSWTAAVATTAGNPTSGVDPT